MTTGPLALSFEEQLEHFKNRNMNITSRDVNKIQNIGYYRLKEFARPFAKTSKKDGQIIIDYNGVSFSEVLTRYYQDKNLRLHFFHAIEKVEVSVKTKLSAILGSNYGAFGYLDFSKWCDKQKFSKFQVEQKQYFFKKSLKKSMEHSFSSDVLDRKNQDKEGFPSVWLAIDVLTFGQMVDIVCLLSKKNKNKLSKSFNCTSKEIESWLKCLNFVRNLCAHNSTIIDLKLKTRPIYRDEWLVKLYEMTDKSGKILPSNRLAVVFLILFHFVDNINEQYGWRNIKKSVRAICGNKEQNAELLGFSDLKSARLVCTRE